MTRKVLLTLLSIVTLLGAKAQDGESPKKEMWLGDFTYERLSIRERKPVPYPTQREADVMFARRIQRVMDSKEKQNLVTRWPNNALQDILFKAAERGDITAYIDDSLNKFYKPDTVIKQMSTTQMISVPSRIYEGEFEDSMIINKFNYTDDVWRYEINEDWIFDKQRGIFYPRVVSICPLYNKVVDGVALGELRAFCIDWREARKLLINEEIFNRHNDGAKFSYYDFFELRLFTSYVTKEPNVFDNRFDQYVELKDNPLAQLLESERAKEELFNWEHDLWQY